MFGRSTEGGQNKVASVGIFNIEVTLKSCLVLAGAFERELVSVLIDVVCNYDILPMKLVDVMRYFIQKTWVRPQLYYLIDVLGMRSRHARH